MRFRKPTHPVVTDMRREISCFALSRAGGFKRPMKFPFQGIETARDHIRIFTPGNRARPPQIIAVTWRRMTFGAKPFFICPRCSARRAFLYYDGLFGYCRVCADLWYLSQRKHRRTRLLYRSHRIRVSLGDETGKPGDKFPPRPYLQRKTTYRRTIAVLRNIEQQYLHIVANDHYRRLERERDELGRYLPCETSDASADNNDAGDDYADDYADDLGEEG